MDHDSYFEIFLESMLKGNLEMSFNLAKSVDGETSFSMWIKLLNSKYPVAICCWKRINPNPLVGKISQLGRKWSSYMQ